MAAIARKPLPLKSLPRSLPRLPILHQSRTAAPSWQARTPIPTSRTTSLRNFGSSAALFEKRYTQDHEWIELNDDKTQGTIGITHHASSALGDIVYVELPSTPLSIAAGDAIGAVESVKSASDILSPISGTVVATNEVLEEKPGLINKGPEGEGWIAKVEVGEEGRKEWEGLMRAEKYKELVEE